MAHIIVPDRTVLEPTINEFPGCPEIYADGAIVKDYGEIVRIMLYVSPRDGPAEQNFLIVMRRTGFDRSLVNAAFRFLKV